MSQPAGVGAAANQDLVTKVRLAKSILPQLINSSPITGAAVDLAQFESATFLIEIGAPGDTLSGSVYQTWTITECDSSGGSYTTVAAANLIDPDGVLASGTLVVDAAGEASKVYQFGYTGGKRYVKIVCTPTGTHTVGTICAASVLKGHARVNPA